jgi:extracellular factor (EF) 3-hydroxypalmitic acid methyl ester biosynthesis protein
VRYYHPYNDHQGNAFYKIGVENNQLATKKPGQLRIRPERLKLVDLKSEHAIYFTVDDQEYQFPLVDISRYSAAFHCDEDDALGFSVSSALEDVEVTFGVKTVFQGTVVVTRKYIEGERYRIVVEPRNAIFDIDVIEEQETMTAVAHSVDALISASKKYKAIDSGFKAVLADMRTFLEGYQKILEMPAMNRLSSEAEQTELLDELNRAFFPTMNEYFVSMDQTVSALGLNEQDHGLYKMYFQKHFHPLLMASPFCHRIYFKPLGYPGDFEMMRMIRENRYEGPTLFAKLINKAMLSNPLGQSNRNRIEFLAGRIASFVRARKGEEVNILSIACGPALEIQKIIDEQPEVADRIHITLLDQEAEALRYSQDSIYMKRIMKNCGIRIELVHQSIGSFLKQVARGKWRDSKYDLIYIFGLFDYFDDRTCGFCLNKSIALLKDNGRMLISNYSLDGHNHRIFMEFAFEWYMVYRDKKQMESLGKTVEKATAMRVDEDSSGVIKFLELQFGEVN